LKLVAKAVSEKEYIMYGSIKLVNVCMAGQQIIRWRVKGYNVMDMQIEVLNDDSVVVKIEGLFNNVNEAQEYVKRFIEIMEDIAINVIVGG